MNPSARWDSYFHRLCEAVASKSSCFSRQIGVVLVRDHSVVSTGYNGPARGVPHCGHERFMKDDDLNSAFATMLSHNTVKRADIDKMCPRHLMGYKSGEGLEWCISTHAEVNAIANAARLGTSTIGTTLYMNCIIPCDRCANAIINAGIDEIVVDSLKYYNHQGKFILDHSDIRLRTFEGGS